jgi:hypothetical protein
MTTEKLPGEVTIHKTQQRNLVEHRVDKLCFALIFLVNSLRNNVKLEEGNAVAAIPVETLDRIEKLILQ